MVKQKLLFGALLLSFLSAVVVNGQGTAVGNVKGRVRVDGSGLTPAGITVIARQGEREIKQGETNGKGEFEIRGLEPGVYGFTFRKPGLSIGTLENIEVRAGKTRSLPDGLYLGVDDGSIAFIRGSVFDANGRAVRGARVEIALVQADGSEKKLDGRLSSSESGLFVFRLSPERAVYRLTAKADGMETATKDVTVEGAARTNVALTLRPAAK